MKASGIITEFNPFHNGHAYIVKKASEDGNCVIAVMSGNYVQRGAPALLSKFVRAKAAITNGVDLVVELPSPWSASFAQNFAFGGVSLLKKLNVEKMYFGTENVELEKLINLAKLDDLKFAGGFTGTFSKARQERIAETLGKDYAKLLDGANNNLAIEYIKAANSLDFRVEFTPITRIGAKHDDTEPINNICSASYLRENFCSDAFDRYAPKNTAEIYNDALLTNRYLSFDKFSTAVISYLRRKDDYASLPDLSEGIENKLAKAVKTAGSYEELLESIKSKRYTLARIRRLVLCAFLDIDNAWTHKEVPYINVLGFSKKGEEYIKTIAKNSPTPFIFSNKSNIKLDNAASVLLNKECRRNDIYMSLLKNPLACGSDYTNGLIKKDG